MELIIHVDGGSRGNPGPAGAGVVIAPPEAVPIFEGGFFLGRQTNNAAEYYALIHALQRVQPLQPQAICIFADSELLVRQVTGEYRVKNPNLARLYEQVQMLLLGLSRWQIRHVKREGNSRADALANMAMDRGEDVIVLDETGTPSDLGVPRSDETAPLADVPPAAPPHVLPVEGGVRRVKVTLREAPADGECVAGGLQAHEFVVEQTLPEGLCVYAAHALLPTILAMHGTEAGEFGSLPTMTVRCTRRGCGAVFQLAPLPASNGSS